MIEIFLLFEKWVDAHHAATRAECRLSHSLDLYCEGIGQAPTVAAIAEARQTRVVANNRLRSLWTLAREARACVAVI